MQQLSDTVIGISLVGLLTGYTVITQAHTPPREAVLAEISMIMNDLEAELKQVESPNGHIVGDVDLVNVFGNSKNTAIIGSMGEPWLMPDIAEGEPAAMLGGCLIDSHNKVMLRTDRSALTQIPEKWETPVVPVVKVCLDLNGAQGPNLEGFDVIWLSFSRTGSPHITLIPVKTQHLPSAS